MTHRYASRLLAASLAMHLGSQATAQDSPEPRLPAAVQMPAVTYLCVPLAGSSSEAEASAAVEEARRRWSEAAEAGGLVEASPLFPHARIELQNGDPVPVGLRLCAIVAGESQAAGMIRMTFPARRGIAGFCPSSDVDACLELAATQGGYTSSRPWPYLPVYALWRASTPPADADAVASYLIANRVSAPVLANSPASPFEVGDSALRPLAPCEGADCTISAPPVEISTPANGVAWFIPAGDEEEPAND